MRKGEVSLENGECVFDLLPPALNGSLEVFSADSGLILEEVVAYQDEKAEDLPVHSLAELFRANIGIPVELLVDGEVVRGVVKSFLDPNYVVVATADDEDSGTDRLYPLAAIASYRFLEPVSLIRQETGYEGKLRVRCRESGVRSATYPVGISYIQGGLSWSPEYIINIDPSEQSGVFSFSGVVQNDVDDLVNTTVYLAESGPQFAFGLSPLVVFATDQGFAANRAELTVRGVHSDKLAFAAGPEMRRLLPGDVQYVPAERSHLEKGGTGLITPLPQRCAGRTPLPGAALPFGGKFRPDRRGAGLESIPYL